MGRPGNRAPGQLTLTLPPEAVERRASSRTPYGGFPLSVGYDIHTSRIAARTPFSSFAGEGGAKRRMGCGPPLLTKSDRATVIVNLRRIIPAFRTPSGPPGRLPHSVEKEAPDEIDLCQSRSPGREGRPLPPRGEGGRVSGRMRVSGAIDQTASHSRSLSSTRNERSSRSGAPKRSSPYGKGSVSPVLW